MRITKTVGQYLFGPGSFDHLDSVIDERRTPQTPAVAFFVDHYFSGKPLLDRLPKHDGDLVVLIDTTDEPTTDGIDTLTAQVRDALGLPAAVVGIGGGATMDSAKAVSNLLANPGKAEDFQGWDLLPGPGVFKVGVPTLSGTGAEGSRTCVMMNARKNLKLGMNSDHTVFDRLVLDPDLTTTAPRDQYFYTGMDTYIHNVESLSGHYRHGMADAFARESLGLCREVFLGGDMQSETNREKLMIASYLGGSAIGNSYVGLVHPLSAGLSMVLHTHHCVGNCIVMNVMDEFYPAETEEFRRMVAAQGVSIPTGLCRDLPDSDIDRMYDATVIHAKPLANALGDDFLSVLTRDKVGQLFRRM
ncbi:alcohol dehydrogenase [Magnetospirillum sp. ME-1]|uniref:iron-containing alcohol dehydrogenase family protein n=1 Tax=Magnetospirillum sp. ME-1 TaxID=1639348 RepID=UPI000A17A49E|nr:iron-containing alcohol dehydrogenase family protein [Magnetospirillum sp. ME-1]ARJ66550.1 alcohol dehydrogenase [Magnetospirillum sp. ME-1]